ncbi:YchJ family protein [Variovorax sp. KK3]|uniref:YchJ family protein n=1 Tax=Variovorax sp. KK3 TaxID=1855728 RepID=UPI00097C80B3|nr:YchJ family metal-binding protein [Variovorax sp. KK3]
MPGRLPDPCPCGRRDRRGAPLVYADCCGRYLDDFERTPAPDAESLMRSRYTAFVRERSGYLLGTWHPSTRPSHLDFEPGVRWLGLEVRAHRAEDADHAEVEFIARHRDRSGAATRLHERSRFVREPDGPGEGGIVRWYYLDGDQR